MSRKLSYYPFLDGLRAFAILWVLLHHLDHSFGLAKLFPESVAAHIARFSYLGLLGVDIFFVISGFLISGLLFEDLGNRIRVRRFYLRRFFKIIPQYVLVVLAGIGLFFWLFRSQSISWLSAVSYGGLFQNYLLPVPTLGHLWSIAVEEHFYFVYPLLLQGLCMCVRGEPARRRLLLWIMLAVMVAVFVIRRATFIQYPYNQMLLFQMTHLRIDALLMGCLLKLAEPALVQSFSSWKRWLAGAFFAAGIAGFVFLFFRFDPCRSSDYVVAYGASGALLFSALAGQRLFLNVLEAPALRWVGKNSYAIYLWHYPLILLVRELMPGPHGLAFILAVGGVCLCLGALSTMTVERYFLNLRSKLIP